MTLGEWLEKATDKLKISGCPDPQVDARWLVEDLLSMNRTEMLFAKDSVLSDLDLMRLNTCLDRRAKGEPIQYVLESAYFMGLKFYVDARVLIPRQDTETLVEACICALNGMDEPKVLDLCTGSGAIGLSIKNLVSDADVTLTDVSKDALEVARRNAHDQDSEVTIKHGDLYEAIGSERFDMIVSNPPYIPRRDIADLQREVRREPVLALDGGEDGLDFYRRIAEGAEAHLTERGMVLLEVGYTQADDVKELMKQAFPDAEVGVLKDINHIDRVVYMKKAPRTED